MIGQYAKGIWILKESSPLAIPVIQACCNTSPIQQFSTCITLKKLKATSHLILSTTDNTLSSVVVPYNKYVVTTKQSDGIPVTHSYSHTPGLLQTVSTMGRRLHPMGLSMQYQNTRGVGMTQQEVRSALFHNSRIRTMEGVALGTQLAYDPGWKSLAL